MVERTNGRIHIWILILGIILGLLVTPAMAQDNGKGRKVGPAAPGSYQVRGLSNGGLGPPADATVKILSGGGDQLYAPHALPGDGSPLVINSADVFGGLENTNNYRLVFAGTGAPGEQIALANGQLITAIYNYEKPIGEWAYKMRGQTNGAPGAPAGAQFRIFTGGGDPMTGWLNLPNNGNYEVITAADIFGDFQGNNYKINFSAVAGYTTPAEQIIAPSMNGTIVTANYVSTATLSVTINQAVSALYGNSPGTFTISGTINHGPTSSNYGPNVVAPGAYNITFADLTAQGWNLAQNLVPNQVLDPGDTVNMIGTYTVATRNLTVDLTLDGGAPQFAKGRWRPLLKKPDNSFEPAAAYQVGGASVALMRTRTYVIEFEEKAGYTTPPMSSEFVLNDNTGAAGNYQTKTGNLQINVTTDPDWDAAEALAGWTVSGVAVNGDAVNIPGTNTTALTGVPIGTYTVNFGAVVGWVAPAAEVVTVEELIPGPAPASAIDGPEASVTGLYTLEMGLLAVNVTTDLPSPTIPGTAPWSVNGTAVGGPAVSTGNTGTTAMLIPTGSYVLSFGDFPGWDTPAEQNFAIGLGGAALNGHYIRHKGSLKVTITSATPGPQVVVLSDEALTATPDHAQWRLQGSVGWRESGTDTGGIPTGVVTIEFHPATGFFAPAPAEVEVGKDALTEIVVNYPVDNTGTGDLYVDFEGVSPSPSAAAPAASTTWFSEPRWRFKGTETWYGGDVKIINLMKGDYPLEFALVPGYVLPDIAKVTVNPGILNEATGEYVRPFVAHASDYDGDGRADLAVFDETNRTWSIASAARGPVSGAAAQVIIERTFGKADDVPTPGDYDGDGIADLAYWRANTGEWRVDGQFTLEEFGQPGDIPVPGDYLGLGRTQAALYRPTKGQWLIHHPDRGSIVRITFGGPEQIPVPGNYDGDPAGRTDPGTYNVLSGRWDVAVHDAVRNDWIVRKKLGGKLGTVGDLPVQGDYDGNGSTDPAIFRRIGSIWSVLDQFEISFGKDGDLPVPNDWAGLGRVIPAIFRVQNGKWLGVDNLLSARHGKGTKPLISGR